MNRLALFALGAGALGAVAAGCGTSSSTGSTPSNPMTGSSTTVVKTASTPVGQVLVGSNGRTLYLFKSDTGTTSTCTGACAATWPAATTTGKPQASGVNAGMLGTAVNAGHTQVTYHGHPLYYYSGDSAAGQVNGQGLLKLWYAVSPSGSADTSMPTSSSPGGSSGGYGY